MAFLCNRYFTKATGTNKRESTNANIASLLWCKCHFMQKLKVKLYCGSGIQKYELLSFHEYA